MGHAESHVMIFSPDETYAHKEKFEEVQKKNEELQRQLEGNIGSHCLFTNFGGLLSIALLITCWNVIYPSYRWLMNRAVF